MRTRHVVVRAASGLSGAVAVATTVLGGCPNPSGQYQDFLSSTADARSALPSSDATIAPPADARPPTELIEGTYQASCITVLSNDDVAKVLRFYADVKFVPESGGGKLTLKLQAFKGWDAAATNPKVPASFSRSETVGASINANDVKVVGAQFNANLGLIDVLGEANSISGRPITIDPLILQGIIDQNAKPAASTSDAGGGADASGEGGAGTTDASTTAGGTGSFCAALGGSLTKPITITLQPGDGSNICLFRSRKEGDPIVLHKLEDFKKSPCSPPTPDGG